MLPGQGELAEKRLSRKSKGFRLAHFNSLRL